MKKFAALAVLLVMAIACGGGANTPGPAQSAGPPEKTSLKAGVGGQGQIIYMPLTLADELGYFK
ncbi:MAG: ABC transporter substrate-binding protein, partial [Candidatus Dormibacteraeota bacterium]|nr:ABC transporter substrate-binding protein [Candidatus Dormibacteraeota bacterium]